MNFFPQPKPTRKPKKRKVKSDEEKRHLELVAKLPCILCGKMPVEIHHIRTRIGMGKRSSHFQTINLCTEHHRGKFGLHGLGRKAFERHYGITELELLEKVKTLLSNPSPEQ